MPQFFTCLPELNRFLSVFRSWSPPVRCPHCHQTRYLNLHDRIQKKGHRGKSYIVGRRLYCSNRYQKKGCGRTTRLSLANHIPSLFYGTLAVCQFLIGLLKHRSIEHAYQAATGAQQHRNAFRWLAKLEAQSVEYRSRGQPPPHFAQHRNERCTRILQSLSFFSNATNTDFCQHYQAQHQVSFM